MLTRSFPAVLANFDQMMTFVREIIYQTEISKTEGKKLELAVEEALVNIINYAFPQSVGQVNLACEIDPKKEKIIVTIKDSGKPFNPLKKKDCLPHGCAPENLKEGGLGIHYIKSLIENVSYEYKEDTNILTLEKVIY